MENPLNYKIIPLLLLPLSIFISFTPHFRYYPFILSVWQQGSSQGNQEHPHET